MPIYEYQCSACGEKLEKIQKFSDPPLTDCPACGKSSLKKKISASAFRLKGSGWYETDFKTGNKKNIAGSADSKTDGDKKSGSDSAGAKTETRTESKSGSESSSSGSGKPASNG